MVRHAVSAFAFAALLGACGGSGSDAGPYCAMYNASTIGTIGCSCSNLDAGGVNCNDFPTAACSTAQSGCNAGAVFTNAPCPTAQRVGTCYNAEYAERIYPPITASYFETVCNNMGECWVGN
jgi:hypothetical protein